MRIENTRQIDAPADDVWELTTDVERLPSVTPTMTSVERLDDGPLAVGSTVAIVQPGQRRRTWTVTELAPPSRFAWSTRLLGTTMTGVHDVAPHEHGCTNTLAIEFDGALAPILGRLLRRPISTALDTENEGFARAAAG